MKSLYCVLIIALLSMAAMIPAYGQCGNDSKGGVGRTPESTEDECTLNAGDPFDPYTGNEYRKVKDLQVWGAVGEIPLEFMRYGTSRYNFKITTSFGTGHNWNHSFNYIMFDAG